MSTSRTSLLEWATTRAPGLSVVSASEPEPVLLRHNLVAVSDEPEVARDVAREWERLEAADGAIGMVVLGRTEPPTGGGKVDPEQVTVHAARRAILGALPGAVAGALFVGLIALLVVGAGGTVIGAAVGGGAFGAVAGAMYSFTLGTGWGAAYQSGFVDVDAAQVVLTSIHSDDHRRIAEATSAVAEVDGVQLFEVDRVGRVRPVGPTVPEER